MYNYKRKDQGLIDDLRHKICPELNDDVVGGIPYISCFNV